MPLGVPLPESPADPIALADWLELSALTFDDGNSSYGDLQRVLGRLGMNDSEELCAEAMNELGRRVDATPTGYPFEFTGSLLSARGDWHSFVPYVFCLLLSYCDDKKKRVRGLRHEVMFEHLSCLAAKRYIGGDGVRFGSPRDTLPAGFRDALTSICAQVGEWTVGPVSRVLRPQDGGLDLVAWKHFPDLRSGKLVLFGHCASGRDWDDKINELQPNDFCSKWLGGDRSPIIKAFFIPHRLVPDVFDDRAISAKLFFDRCRIAHWATNDEFRTVTGGRSEKWCRKLLQRLPS